MGFLAVIVAALGGFAWGAAWYMSLGKKWQAAVGLSDEEVTKFDPVPFVIALAGAALCAGMMRHVFVSGGVDGFWASAVGGFGLGLFVACPWLVTNYAFAKRSKTLWWIDGGYAVGGCTAIGAVLGLF